MAHLFVHVVIVWLGWCTQALEFACIFLLMDKMILKYTTIHAAPPKQKEFLVISCILIPTVTPFHKNVGL